MSRLPPQKKYQHIGHLAAPEVVVRKKQLPETNSLPPEHTPSH